MKRIHRRSPDEVVSPTSASSELDLSKIYNARNIGQSERTKNVLNLIPAPVFYPTPEEFKDPLGYIEKIRPEAEQFGVCKITPPSSWRPRFALDTTTFRFKTRVQRLNSMEASTRAVINFVDSLMKFHAQRGRPMHHVPVVCGKPLNMYLLKKLVTENGGYHKVCENHLWKKIASDIGMGTLDNVNVYVVMGALKTNYARWILPFEEYTDGKREEKQQNFEADDYRTPSPAKVRVVEEQSDSVAHSRSRRRTSMRHQETVETTETPRRSSRRVKAIPQITPTKKPDCYEPGTICEKCWLDDEKDTLVTCNNCSNGYHVNCTEAFLNLDDSDEWYCPECLKIGDELDYAFDEGRYYSLSEFQKFADSFKANWFAKRRGIEGQVNVEQMLHEISETETEEEFWRLCETPYESVEVEYGADLHSSEHGSGFPKPNPSSKDVMKSSEWNLNAMSTLPKSLLSFMDHPIPGMMVPWIYVGMCFSAFCWHVEDHNTPSINYMHWGDTKTWYGIPSSHADAFESVMRQEFPQLFKAMPDVLFHITTMLSPKILRNNDVKVVTLDQRPGDFVVTFPRSYHAGFNHGFNFAEAVNFATPDWMKYGYQSIVRYKEYQKSPVFPHDELILKIATHESTGNNWIRPYLKEAYAREMATRKVVKRKFRNIQECDFDVPLSDVTDADFQCFSCKSFNTFSQILCLCSPKKVACVDHVHELCKCGVSKKRLRVRVNQDFFESLLE